jgi:prepilin peptidase CpaA
MEWKNLSKTVLLSFFFLSLIFSAYTDLSKGKIYNWITYPFIISGFLFRFLSDGMPGLISSLSGAFLGFIFLFVFFLADGVGAGDVKLLSSIGAFGGGIFVLWTLWYSAIIGGFVALFMLILKGRLWEGLKDTFFLLKNILFLSRHKLSLAQEKKITVPYGVIIVISTYLTYFMKGI